MGRLTQDSWEDKTTGQKRSIIKITATHIIPIPREEKQPTEEITAKMIKLAKDSGYRGWYGIESSGREEIKKGIGLLKKYLSIG